MLTKTTKKPPQQNPLTSQARVPGLLQRRQLLTPATNQPVSHTPSATGRGFYFGNIPVLQPKLTIGQPNDKYEQEADHVADQVMRMPEPVIQRQGADTIQGHNNKSLLQTMGQAGAVPAASPGFISGNQTKQGGGQPLAKSSRAFFELRLGHDFSQVRIHDGPWAAKAAQSINARAYTMGRNITFAKGQYQPGSTQGKKLLAHELTHVVQQGESGRAIQRQPAEENTTAETVGDVSVHAGITMTAEAALREVYARSARQISEEALRMVARGVPVEEAARWATQARNSLKVQIRASGSPITRGLAEARNIRRYGNAVGPTYDDLIRQGKTPQDILGSSGRASQTTNRLATRIRVAGRFLIAIDLAIVTWEVVTAPEGERGRTAAGGVGGVAGALAGGWAGAKGGAAFGGFIGSFFGPGPGTAIGGAVVDLSVA